MPAVVPTAATVHQSVATSPTQVAVQQETLPTASRSRDLGASVRNIFSLKTLLLVGAGAALGALVPVIPGGPIGGAVIGAVLSQLL